MLVKRYRPAYFTGFEEEEAEVSTLAELMALPWIASWKRSPDFHRYSLSHDGPGKLARIMAELDGGQKFWVAANVPLAQQWIIDALPAWSLP